MGKLIDIANQRFGRLVAVEHVGFDASRQARWSCRCDCAGVVVALSGNLRRGLTTSCGCHRAEVLKRGPVAARRPDDEATYTSSHKRVVRARGRAATHLCHLCSAPAHEWAFRADAPEPLVELVRGHPCLYSGNPDDYLPLCRPCHRAYDREARLARA